jgi:type II restriction enzyme
VETGEGFYCNIDVSNVPDLGKIFFVQNGVVRGKEEVLAKWSQTEFVRSTGDVNAKGWLLDVLLCVEKIRKQDFSLDDVYAFEGHLQAKHPENHNVKAKIRQQLQFLRDRDVIEFLGRGRYRMRLVE